jgi:23S rRNA (guanosine2251-2'-O)-methyltransferase
MRPRCCACQKRSECYDTCRKKRSTLHKTKVRYLCVEKLTAQQLTQLRHSPESLLGAPRTGIRVIVSNVRSVYNVGSIFRTCDAFRVEHLYLCGYTPTPPRVDLQKTALGAADTVAWSAYQSTRDAITDARACGCLIMALELTQKAIPLHGFQAPDPIAIVLGNELTGVEQQLLDLCDGSLVIPMYGVKHSLNVAVAAGIALYHLAVVQGRAV